MSDPTTPDFAPATPSTSFAPATPTALGPVAEGGLDLNGMTKKEREIYEDFCAGKGLPEGYMVVGAPPRVVKK